MLCGADLGSTAKEMFVGLQGTNEPVVTQPAVSGLIYHIILVTMGEGQSLCGFGAEGKVP
jgi:hypothetical protein